MGNRKPKLIDGNYHTPETIGLVYCIEVLEIVLKEHPKAKELYEDIKDCLRLPGFKETINIVERSVPGGKQIIENIARKAGFKNKQPPSEKNPAKVARDAIVGTTKLVKSLTNKVMIPIVLSMRRRRDLKLANRSVERFIRICFNRESDQVKGKYRVTGNTSTTLGMVVLARAMLDVYKQYNVIGKMDRIPMYKYSNKLFSVKAVFQRDMPDRASRSLVEHYRAAGFRLKHDERLDTTAWRWYQCRVVHAGPKEYYLSQLKETSPEDRAIVEPENLSHELKECDEAIGYAREKTGKRKT